ncbi:ATP-dependent RNA helicase DDX24 [Corythoichthys intestinalis]|uniref:ATP-dependent RNA helicase DDX24 n=1 Tax=Corythoichthys intestinalis TaxID=161448 RepID=UPI0025A4ECD5|nr:ATP-dependent RNA helicase DDX24 [Corythoichthys intestinalis]XP_057715599.1 ATP-dependent RNA helicase DDX24 [Corythoichthys intestinalis]XP_061798044.1 ATP-dependent RNA helicase DDX24-like [Nerophis lumbriciformis]
MDTNKTKKKRMSFAPRKNKKRNIHVTGKWKAVDLDPEIFSDAGLEGLVCFEKLTKYTLVDSKNAASHADNDLKDKKKKGKKRKLIEAEEVVEKGDADSKTSEKTAKKKKKKNISDDESIQEETPTVEALQEDVSEEEEIKSDEEDTTVISEPKPKKKKKGKKQKKGTETAEQTNTTQDKERRPKKQLKNWTNAALSGSEVKNSDMHAWKDLFVPPVVLQALNNLGFTSPTPIQALVLPSAIRDRMDILGAAETGSGKTLAFGIPMIHNILEWKENSKKPGDEDVAPDVMPGSPEPNVGSPEEEEEGEKEGGITVQADEGESVEDGSEDDEKDQDGRLGCVKVIEDVELDDDTAVGENGAVDHAQPLLGLVLTPTRELAVQVKHHIDAVAKLTDIKTAIVVGGMALQKQRRLLNYRPEIVIATPGRLWDLIKEKHPHLLNLRRLKTLVIDEADRMVERGHFAELESLLEMLNTTHFNPKRQNFVFSATLTMSHTLPMRVLQKKKMTQQTDKVALLMEKVGMKSKPKVIDLTRKQATVETLTETQIHCQKEEKDFFLYYFLLQYPGRTMVFANSIDTIKRLNSLLIILDCTPLPLHGNMHQKQRLKNLERFAERESCVLLTTDVAARGLDIPNVQHVIHYQVPRTSETYVHRSGRTARATKEGLSLLLIGPDDVLNFKKIYRNLGKDEELPTFPVEIQCMAAIKERVNLARKIEKIEFYNSRQKHHNSWLRQTAEAMEIDVDEDLLLGKGRDEDDDREQQMMVKGMKKHLKHLISQNVFKSVTKTKYPTQMGRLCTAQLSVIGEQSALMRLTAQKKTQTGVPQHKKGKKKSRR